MSLSTGKILVAVPTETATFAVEEGLDYATVTVRQGGKTLCVFPVVKGLEGDLLALRIRSVMSQTGIYTDNVTATVDRVGDTIPVK